MYLCDDDHDEVCYEGRYCPCCELQKQIQELEEKIDALQDELKEERDARE